MKGTVFRTSTSRTLWVSYTPALPYIYVYTTVHTLTYSFHAQEKFDRTRFEELRQPSLKGISLFSPTYLHLGMIQP